MDIGKLIGTFTVGVAAIAIIGMIVSPGSAAPSFVSNVLTGYSGIITAAKK